MTLHAFEFSIRRARLGESGVCEHKAKGESKNCESRLFAHVESFRGLHQNRCGKVICNGQAGQFRSRSTKSRGGIVHESTRTCNTDLLLPRCSLLVAGCLLMPHGRPLPSGMVKPSLLIDGSAF
jgi:hypothetical protein